MIKIFALEGLAGGGKTTALRFLANHHKLENFKFLSVSEKELEPFKSWIMEWHQRKPHERIFNMSEIKKVAKARAEIHCWLRSQFPNYDFMFFDRTIYTSMIYQSSESIDWSQIWKINLEADIIVPNSTFLFMGDPFLCYQRVIERSWRKTNYNLPAQTETFEQIEKHRKNYLAIRRIIKGLVIIKAEWSTEKQVTTIINHII